MFFNLGVEAGQVLILLIGFPICRQILKNPKGQLIRIIFSVLIAHIAWHWMSQRWEVAAKFLPVYLQF
jgi:predicted ABC-type exoprotein transport system permease subunit